MVAVGSQAILGSYDEAVLPGEATFSVEADIVPLGDVDGRRADLIDGAIGEASMFHETYGIYAEGVGLSTAMPASGWDERLVPLVDRSTGTTSWCLDVRDLCVAKLLAGRQKDRDFVAAIIGGALGRSGRGRPLARGRRGWDRSPNDGAGCACSAGGGHASLPSDDQHHRHPKAAPAFPSMDRRCRPLRTRSRWPHHPVPILRREPRWW